MQTSIRIAHITDVHFYRTPSLVELPGRAVITAYSRLIRPQDSSRDAQDAMSDCLAGLQLDAVVGTGDFCSTQSEQEFVAAAAFFEKCCGERAGFVVPGNHDTRRRGSEDRPFDRHFCKWITSVGSRRYPAALKLGFVTLVGIDQSPGSTVQSSGFTGDDDLAHLGKLLHSQQLLDGQTVVLCEHYPWAHANGSPFDSVGNRLLDLTATQRTVMKAHYAPHVLLHGHVHDGWTDTLMVHNKAIVTANPGGGAVAFDAQAKRGAAFNVYTFAREKTDQTQLIIEPWCFNGTEFIRQASQAFALRQ